MDFNISFGNNPDGESFFFNQEITYKQDMFGEQQRVEVSAPGFTGDENYTRVLFATNLDSCKLVKGIWASVYSKVVMENLEKAFETKYSCDRIKNHLYKVTNCTCTDNFLPPMPVELKFKLALQFFYFIRGEKKKIPTYTVEFFGRWKK